MYTKLSDIARVRSGLLFRESLGHDPKAEYQVIQISDVSDEGFIDWERLNRVDLRKANNDVMVCKGDVLFKAKGAGHTAAVVDKTIGKTIANSQFHIIRVYDKQLIMPAYLAWYINQKQAQQFLHKMSAGSSIMQVSRKNLDELPVIVPDLQTQNTIVKLDGLLKKEKELMQQIQQKHQKLVEAVMLNKINNY